MQIKEQIIKQAIAIIGSSIAVVNSGNKLDNAERICSVFVKPAIEEVFLSILWKDAIKLIPRSAGKSNEFVFVPDINDCVKIIAISPSNCQWYIDKKKIYFKGKELSGGFYYSDEYLKNILNEQITDLPSMFIILCSLYLASNIAHTLYSDSVFTDGIKKQYLQKIEETKKLYYFDYNLTYSGRFA